MPYAPPTPSKTTTVAQNKSWSPSVSRPSLGRPGHRRSYSSHPSYAYNTTTPTFSNEKISNGGAHGSLGTLPRVKKTPPKGKFHLNESSGSSSDEDDSAPPPLQLKVRIGGGGMGNVGSGGVPFPRSSPLSSPLPVDPPSTNHLAPPARPGYSRTSSSPILLSNGKPLKSSLKSSSSTSNLPVPPHPHHQHHNQIRTDVQHSAHLRARSAPSAPWDANGDLPSGTSTPNSSPPQTPKNVHFPSLPTDLEHIRVFNKSAKPISFLRRSSDVARGPTGMIPGAGLADGEAETETETENERAKFPTTSIKDSVELDMELRKGEGDHVRMDSVKLVQEGTDLKMFVGVLVRNIAYEKTVVLRFTMDEWATVSEVGAKWEASNVSPNSYSSLTLGDIISTHSRCASEPSLGSASGWDRFVVTLPLTDYLYARPPLVDRTMWGVVRYTVPGRGEWWDNNRGENFKFRWKKVQTQVTTPASARGRVQAVGMTRSWSVPTGSAPATTFMPAYAVAPASEATHVPDTRGHEALENATHKRLRKFSFSNYVAPKPSSTSPPSSPTIKMSPPPQASGSIGLFWPWSSSSSSTSAEAVKPDSPIITSGGSASVEILGGRKDYFGNAVAPAPSLPISMDVPGLDSGSSTSTSTSSSTESLDKLMLGGAAAASSFMYGSPGDSLGASFALSGLEGLGLGYDSYDGGFLSSSKTATPKATKTSTSSGSETEKESNTPSTDTDAGRPSQASAEKLKEDKEMLLSPLSPSLSLPLGLPLSPNHEGGGASDSLYKAFVKQWCFIESPRGTPGVGVGA